MDIVNAPADIRSSLTKSLPSLDVATLNTFTQLPVPDPKDPWTTLRAVMFESIRLSGPITGPARICLENVNLPSSTSTSAQEPQSIPKGQVVTLSAYWTHRSTDIYGDQAKNWLPSRFLHENPKIGSPSYVTWGLEGPHMCPGRWFAQECLLVMTKVLLGGYGIVPDRVMTDDEKYIYSACSVARRDVGVTIHRR